MSQRIRNGPEMRNIAEPESPYFEDYVGPERYDDYDGGESVINHLMFYKSIISEEDSGQKISEYMELVRGMKEGEHLPIKDPFDKSIALTFELVMQHHLNPWDVDLLKFSNLYMDRMKHEQDVDFITAGRLMFMAWSVLKLQSDQVLAANQPKPEEAATPGDAAWASSASGDWIQSDTSYDFTTAVLERPEPPIQESIWRKAATRPVTLFELVGAFEDARKEAELQKVINEERRKQRVMWENQKELRVGNMMHREDLHEDINTTWGRIMPLSGRIPLSKLCPTGCDDERLTAFVSVLFLAFVKQVHVWQENFPYGEIYVEKTSEGALDLDKLQAITHPAKKELWDAMKKKGKRFCKKSGKGKANKSDSGDAPKETSSKRAHPPPEQAPTPVKEPVHSGRKAPPSPSPYAAPNGENQSSQDIPNIPMTGPQVFSPPAAPSAQPPSRPCA